MPKPNTTGPKPGRMPLEHMPVERLAEVLPDGSALREAVAPPPPPPPRDTGITGAFDAVHGHEPWLFDEATTRLLADLNPGTADSFVYSAVGVGNSIYLLASLYAGGTVLVRWDSTTNTTTTLHTDARSQTWPGPELVQVGDKLYFEGPNGVLVVDPVTDEVSPLALPATANVIHVDSFDGDLFVYGVAQYESSITRFDAESQAFTVYTIPGFSNQALQQDEIGGAGTHYFVSTSSTVYSINLESGAVVAQTPGSIPAYSHADTDQFWYGVNRLGDSLFYRGIDGVYQANGLTGEVSLVIAGNAVETLGGSSSAAYYFDSITEVIYKLTFGSDGNLGISQWQTDLTDITADGLFFEGSLYFGANAHFSGWAIYRLNEDPDAATPIELVKDFGNTFGYEGPLVSVNGHFIAVADADGDGDYQLWSTDNPALVDSWVQISPDDVNFGLNYGFVVQGDYLIS